MKRLSAVFLLLGPGLALTLASGGCKSQPDMNAMVNDLGDQIDRILGRSTLPGQHLARLAAVHEDDRNWQFKADVPDALERARTAVRDLAACDYSRWSETAFVVQVLTTILDEHPSALLRAESLDTLAAMSVWTESAVPPTDRRATDEEVLAALQTIKEAAKIAPEDPGAAADLAEAINTLAAYRFDASKAPPAEADPRTAGRVLKSRMATCRGVLKALNGPALARFEADPRVRDALDRAYVSASAGAIRASIQSAALADRSEIARCAAVRSLGKVRTEIGAEVLGVAVRGDLNSAVRRDAARSLQAYEMNRSVPGLLPALSDDMPDVRAAAIQSLVAVSGENLGEDRNAWARWWTERNGGRENGAPGSQDGDRN